MKLKFFAIGIAFLFFLGTASEAQSRKTDSDLLKKKLSEELLRFYESEFWRAHEGLTEEEVFGYGLLMSEEATFITLSIKYRNDLSDLLRLLNAKVKRKNKRELEIQLPISYFEKLLESENVMYVSLAH